MWDGFDWEMGSQRLTHGVESISTLENCPPSLNESRANGAGLNNPTINRLVVAYDGSDNALRACESAAYLAKNLGAEARLLFVIPTLSIYTAPLADNYYAVQQDKADGLTQKGMAVFEKWGVKGACDIVRARWSVVETIVNYANEKQCDLILMGARGAGGFEKMLMGSVSSGVVTHANCRVMVVR